jgi:hypothetical protein
LSFTVQTRSTVWSRLFRDPLVIANVLLLAASLLAGRVLYAGAFAYADSLNMLSPYPQLDAAGATNVTATNLAQYVQHWYLGLNGRWSQALMNGALSTATKTFGFGPESFPWWMMRSLSLFCMLATPLNFLAGAGAFARQIRPMGVCLLVLAWGIWSFSQNTYAYSIWFDCLLTDRFVPMYLASVLAVGIARGWPGRRPLALAGFGAVYLFVAIEQFMVTLPVLLAGYAICGRAPDRAARTLRIFAGSVALSGVSALIYFSSPGQHWRNGLMNVKAPDLSPAGLFTWFKESTPLGFGVLFGHRDPAIYWWLHLLLLVSGTGALLIAAFIAWRAPSTKPSTAGPLIERQDAVRWAVFATCFNAAYAASLATLLVSPHFPEYAAQYPALLLTLGLVFSVAAIARLVAAPGRAAVLTAACAVAVVLTVTVPAIRTNVASFQEEAAYARLRKAVYHRVLDLNRETGVSAFVLTNSPIRSIGGTVEPPWGLSAYFRWAGKSDLLVLIDTNYDFATRPRDRKYITIDLAPYWTR